MHAKSKLSDMLPKSFNAGKCKTALKLAASRINLLKNKREAALKQMTRELAQLLEAGQEQTARIRVEYVIREKNAMSAYDLIEVYCEMIALRLPIIESQKSCPIDMKEAITSVVFAAPRCTDIPELTEVRKQFAKKYGKEFITAVTEVRPDCGVSRMMVEKLSTKSPNVEVKIEVLKASAKEHNVIWEPNPFGEQHIQMPKEDLIIGPTSFTSGKMNMKSSSAHREDNVPTRRVSENDLATAEPVISNATPVNAKGLDNLVSSRISEGKSSGEEVNHTYSKVESTSMSRSNWNVEFKDATEAAEAAAESAEMASLAARAAVELASRGSFTRNQYVDRESLVHAEKNERSGSLRSSKLQNTSIVKEYMDGESGMRRGTDDIKMDLQYQQKGNMAQGSRSPKAKSLNYRQPKAAEMMQGRSRSSGLSQESRGTQHDNSQKSFSDRSAAANKFNNGINDDRAEILNEKNSKSVPSPGSTSSDDLTIWPDRESITVDSSEVASVDYDSDADAHSAIGEEEDLLDFLRHGMRQSSRTKAHARESLSTGSSLQRHSVIRSHHSRSLERVIKVGPSNLKKSQSAYDSNGANYASGEDFDAAKSSSLRTQDNHRKQVKRVVEEDTPDSWSASSLDARPGFNARTSQRTSRNISSPSAPDSSKGPSEEEASDSPFSEESSVCGGLNLGRLTGGLKNRSYHRPLYVREPSTDDSPRSSITSVDTSLVGEREVISDTTSFEARTEQKTTKESRAKVHAFKLDASEEEQSHKFQVPNQVPYEQKPRAKVNNDPDSRMLNRYSDFDADESEEKETRRSTAPARNSDIKHSRRTEGSSEVKSSLRSEAGTFSMNTSRAKGEDDRKAGAGESKHRHLSAGGSAKSFDDAPTAGSSQKEKARNFERDNDGSSKESSSSSTATSRESSLKKASHTHPKLPDYESLAAHFLSLRSNVRQK